jgi:ABC-type proline/glycine betaine transport system permease subunit
VLRDGLLYDDPRRIFDGVAAITLMAVGADLLLRAVERWNTGYLRAHTPRRA